MFINNEKATTDVGPNARYLLGAEEARRFYTSPRVVVRGVNKGGLGWSGERFNQVAWTALDRALQSKPDMYQLWLSKQCIGISATRRNLARIRCGGFYRMLVCSSSSYPSYLEPVYVIKMFDFVDTIGNVHYVSIPYKI